MWLYRHSPTTSMCPTAITIRGCINTRLMAACSSPGVSQALGQDSSLSCTWWPTVCRDGVYVADRENHRIQVFDSTGKFLTMWNNMYRPCGLHMEPRQQPALYIGELSAPIGYKDAPSLRHRVDIMNLDGQMLCNSEIRLRVRDQRQLIGSTWRLYGLARGIFTLARCPTPCVVSHENPRGKCVVFRSSPGGTV